LEVEVPAETPTTIKLLAGGVGVPQKNKRYISRAPFRLLSDKAVNAFLSLQVTQIPASMHRPAGLAKRAPLETLSHWVVLAEAEEALQFFRLLTRLLAVTRVLFLALVVHRAQTLKTARELKEA
jgi:hypothetical protein